MTTASRSVLLGMVPVSMQTPPTAAALLDDRGALAELGRLHGGALPGRAAADADEVVVVIAHDRRRSARARMVRERSQGAGNESGKERARTSRDASPCFREERMAREGPAGRARAHSRCSPEQSPGGCRSGPRLDLPRRRRRPRPSAPGSRPPARRAGGRRRARRRPVASARPWWCPRWRCARPARTA